MKAIWNGQIVAESYETIVIEGNHYFPSNSINKDYFSESTTNSFCPWKGTASYYSLDVEGKKNNDAAWYYPDASDLARKIEGMIAFWKGVEVTK